MAFLRPLFFAATLSFIACGSSSNNAPTGPHYHYVASRVLVPTQTGDATKYGLDLDGDGNPDNALGNLLTALSTQGINAQTSIDEAVYDGSISLLADVQTTSFSSAGTAGIQVYLGSDSNPAACNAGEMVTCGSGADATCTGCQHQLSGTAMFSIDPSSPMDAALAGPIIGGTFKGGPGNLSLEISIGGAAATEVDLIGARVQGTGITATALGTESDDSTGVIFGGAIPETSLDSKVIPSIVPVIQGVLTTHCPGAVAGNCMCDATGNTVLGLFDTNKDCMVSSDEIINSSFGMTLLAPDVTINGMPALSLGVKVYGVGATYTVAGEGSD
ncbi:MAG TPA: hypothetical protein VGL61_23230 [Kofleriaceae bacterium]|jgi:hypothetical protein